MSMKKILLIIFLLISINPCFAQWSEVSRISYGSSCSGYPIPVNLHIISVNEAYWSLSREYCSHWAPAEYSIWRSGNSFLTNEYFEYCGGYSYGGYLGDVDFISYDTIFLYDACYGSSQFRKTTDGGNSWINLSLQNHPSNLDFLNSHLGYGFVGDSLWRFYNDSMYFVTEVNNFEIDKYYLIDFTDSLHGFVFREDTVMRTTDGGLNWSQLNFGIGRYAYPEVEMINDSVGYINTTDGSDEDVYKND
jgi:hypothetical protein